MRRSMFPTPFDLKHVDERMIRDLFDGLCQLENRLEGGGHTQRALLQKVEGVTNKFLFDYEGNKLRECGVCRSEKTPVVELKTDEELLNHKA